MEGLFEHSKNSLLYSTGPWPVVQTMDSAIHRINHYPLDNSIGFACVYSVDSDLPGGQRYPLFEQLGPGVFLEASGDVMSRYGISWNVPIKMM